MIISTLRFDSFQWEHNPLYIEVTYKQDVKVQRLQGAGAKAQSHGVSLRVVKGKGEIAGENCLSDYARLCALFEKGTKGLLTLPFAPPFYAYFTDLTLKGEVTPRLITYTFEFCEAENGAGVKQGDKAVVRQGDTLFDIAFENQVSVDKLVALNPGIKRPDELFEGMEVRLC